MVCYALCCRDAGVATPDGVVYAVRDVTSDSGTAKS